MLHQPKARGQVGAPGSAKKIPESPTPWLLLVHQLPVRPSNVRVKTWRRLQDLGAVAVKNSVYALPNTPATQEDFEWIKTEITTLGGQASVFAAGSVDAWSDDELREAFRRARQGDYETLARTLTSALAGVPDGAKLKGARLRRAQRLARAAHEQLARIQAVDFFSAAGREAATTALARLDDRLAGQAGRPVPPATSVNPHEYRGRTWATRPRPGIDRLSSAWLIRKHIDPEARFVFGGADVQGAGVVTFDTFGGTFTHEGPYCTFETLASRFGLTDPIVERLGQIVHDLDLKDAKFGVAEAVAVGWLVDGLGQLYPDDHLLLDQGIILFEALYQGFKASEPHDRQPSRASTRRMAERQAKARTGVRTTSPGTASRKKRQREP
jgi:hypothetical protein